MARYLNYGETATRPGLYYNYDKADEGPVASAVDGVTAILFQSDWGPLNKPIMRSADEGYADVFGSGGSTNVIDLAFEGGTRTGILVRVGTGGTQATTDLEGTNAEEGSNKVTLTAKYVGARKFTASIRDSISSEDMRELIIYDGTKEFEKVSFPKGDDEVSALVDAMSSSPNFTAKKEGNSDTLKTVTQQKFTDGTDPTASVTEYSEAMEVAGTIPMNCICLDTSDYSVITLLNAHLSTMLSAGSNVIAVVAEKKETDLDERIKHAAACNLSNMVYVVNANLEHGLYGTIDGHMTAAKICGMVSGTSCKYSLTHTVLSGITELNERLKDGEINKAEQSGCLVLSNNSARQVWIDCAINTLVTPAPNQDAGWKKIRRTKTRFELLTRANNTIDEYVGQVDNEPTGRIAIKDAIESVGIAMITEQKLSSITVSEDATHPAEGDSCWFIINAIDKDSAEHIYLRYLFRFSTGTLEEVA